MSECCPPVSLSSKWPFSINFPHQSCVWTSFPNTYPARHILLDTTVLMLHCLFVCLFVCIIKFVMGVNSTLKFSFTLSIVDTNIFLKTLLWQPLSQLIYFARTFGSHDGVYEDCCLLGRDVAWLVENYRYFGGRSFLRKPVPLCITTLCHIAGGNNHHLIQSDTK